VAWQPPPPEVRELRAVARRIAALVAERAAEKKPPPRAGRDAGHPRGGPVTSNIRALTRRITQLLRATAALIAARGSFSDTVGRLLSAFQAHRIKKTSATIDQRAKAAAVGLTMPPTALIIFGSPNGSLPAGRRIERAKDPGRTWAASDG
jgi:hypothetical protein